MKHRSILPLLAALAILDSEYVQAASSFDTYANLTFTISSVSNQTNPGDFSGLEILGYFEQVGSPDSYAVATGDGSVTADNSSVSGINVSTNFSKLFNVSASVSDGMTDSSHLAYYELRFNNLGVDTYSISVVLDYELSSSVTGESAYSEVFPLNYFNDDETFSGSNSVSASTNGALSSTVIGSSGIYSFTLDANATQGMLADVRISGTLEASPVPLPAAIWMFVPSLGGLVLFPKRRKG